MSNRPPDGTPGAAEFGLLRAFLTQQGYTQKQIKDAIGIKPDGRTRAEMADGIIDWLRGDA